MGDQMHPCGKLDLTVYKRIGNIFEQIERMESWLYDTKKVREIAVLIPTRAGTEDPSLGGMSEEGVYRVLSELHLPFDFVNKEDSLEDSRLLILPDHAELDGKYAEIIAAFVKGGGKLLVSGTCSFLFHLTFNHPSGSEIDKIHE
nr:beta-galactosidase trimerization domain-containing protein [uncultured Blautia sp.]